MKTRHLKKFITNNSFIINITDAFQIIVIGNRIRYANYHIYFDGLEKIYEDTGDGYKNIQKDDIKVIKSAIKKYKLIII